MQHKIEEIIHLFNQTFESTFQTRLVKGDDEPIYLPADESNCYHRVVFAHGYYASALHEIAHWCIAGAARRLLEDYGYWYCPDGRDETQQAKFEVVEVKPQAVEWGLAVAAGFPFQVSCDNLNGVEPDRLAFQKKVYDQVGIYLSQGFPPRAETLMKALAKHYGISMPLSIKDFEFKGRVEDAEITCRLHR
ncbi:elongation factor P hydroxylase [Algicola sagamiensis]|uniref:elongation factor P hydroxylase n=1 Tax=Algicola sagamiensis TaxID=163869 RepID=UPI000361CCAF|nr:elongation factor P hydroxylase [Algicola sagamiensis]